MAATLPLSPPTDLPPFRKRRRVSGTQTREPEDAFLQYLHDVTHLLPRPPTKAAFISAIKACSLLSSSSSSSSSLAHHGRALHAHVLKAGLRHDRFVASSLIGFYSSCAQVNSARQLFDGIPHKDAALRTAMLMCYSENGHVDRARGLFDEMTAKDVVAWNAMINAYSRCGLPDGALRLFREMQVSRCQPNEVTLIGALSACSQMGCLALGEWIHVYIERHPEIKLTRTLGNALVNMYAKCGRIDAALELFLEEDDDGCSRNLESWNTMLTGLATNGCGTGALSLFAEMIKLGVQPDRITLTGLLMACSHAGMVEDGRRCFHFVTGVQGVEADAEHYGCVVDVLSRGGHVEEAMAVIRSMPFAADAGAWGALLHGCYVCGNYELGLEAARHLIDLEPMERGRYVALLNLYSKAAEEEEEEEEEEASRRRRVRKVMDERCIRGASGMSIIEIDGVFHHFLAGGIL